MFNDIADPGTTSAPRERRLISGANWFGDQRQGARGSLVGIALLGAQFPEKQRQALEASDKEAVSSGRWFDGNGRR
jgi:hypothetical protein